MGRSIPSVDGIFDLLRMRHLLRAIPDEQHHDTNYERYTGQPDQAVSQAVVQRI